MWKAAPKKRCVCCPGVHSTANMMGKTELHRDVMDHKAREPPCHQGTRCLGWGQVSSRDPAWHEATAVMKQHQPYAWGRSSGFPVTGQLENFSYQLGMGFHLLHTEGRAVGSTVEVKAEMKTKPNSATAVRVKWGGEGEIVREQFLEMPSACAHILA